MFAVEATQDGHGMRREGPALGPAFWGGGGGEGAIAVINSTDHMSLLEVDHTLTITSGVVVHMNQSECHKERRSVN